MVTNQTIVVGNTEVDITQSNETVVEFTPPDDTVIETYSGAPGTQGPRGFGIYVQNNNPGLTVPGLWIQTGLGADGTGVTFWIEDGK